MDTTHQDDTDLFDTLGRARADLTRAIGQRIVGQDAVVESMLISLFAGGHSLFIGVPGLAKTLLVSTVAEALGLEFGRVQFTPDLMPTDITGTEVLEENRESGRREMRFLSGPVFTNLLLADEINRAPAKTQAALLQAMAEGTVTVGGQPHALEPPFMVFATQNPIEQEGTYPLPEAQLDRFMFSIDVGYPSEAEEVAIVERTTTGTAAAVEPVIDRGTLLQLQRLVRRLPTSTDVHRYAVALARATRPGQSPVAVVNEMVSWGAGPRASQFLALGARVRAALHGHEVPSVHDVDAVAHSVLNHRVVLSFKAEAAGLTASNIVDAVLAEVAAP
ncbi:MAG: MoxR family ATPase [Myxococcota bacterium]|nr:MoxR family ATPase [Myxococcota bacterium]